MAKLLAIIDTQYDFMMPDGALYVPGAEETIVPGIQYLKNLNSKEIDTVIFTYDTHDREVYETSEEAEQFPIHCERFTPGWGNVFNSGLIDDVNIGVWELQKSVFNMWEEDDVVITDPLDIDNTYQRDVFFKDIQKTYSVNTVVVWGEALDFCVKWAVDGFIQRGFKVELVEHLCRGIVEKDARVVFKDYIEQGMLTIV